MAERGDCADSMRALVSLAEHLRGEGYGRQDFVNACLATSAVTDESVAAAAWDGLPDRAGLPTTGKVASQRACPSCGHDLANHYADRAWSIEQSPGTDVTWCANCDAPCGPPRRSAGGPESQVAPGLLADEERSAPPADSVSLSGSIGEQS